MRSKHIMFILFLLVVMLSTMVGVVIAQALTPEQQQHSVTIGLIFNALTAVLIVPIVTKLKEKFPFITGFVTVIISSLFGLLIVYLYDLVFKINVWAEPDFFKNLIIALGINQTMAASVYEIFKKKTPPPTGKSAVYVREPQ
jgi:hypothetical protein